MNAPANIDVTESVHAKIAAITGELAKTGISKTRRNKQQGYAFRGIDEVYSALSPLLAKHRLNILPRILNRDVVERRTTKGGVLFNVTVDAEFDFVSVDDGSMHVVRTIGEAMDSADKATNKAMSAAYKYAAFMAFAIPTGGDNDADSSTHEVAPQEGHSQGQDQGDASPPAPKNWGGRYPTKTALKKAMHEHHAELERLRLHGNLDDLEGYLTSPEYQDYVAIAGIHAPAYLEGPLPDSAPPEFTQTFALEQLARDAIALRGNQSLEEEAV